MTELEKAEVIERVMNDLDIQDWQAVHDALEAVGFFEQRARLQALLEMQEPLARTLLDVRDALQSLPEEALGEGESGGASWPIRDELLDGVEHCLKLQRGLKERADALTAALTPTKGKE